MRRLWEVGILVVLVALILTPCTSARDMKGQFGIGGNIGYSMMDTKGVNDYIDIWQERVKMLPVSPVIGKEHMKGTVSYLGEIRYGVTSNLMLTASGGFMSTGGRINATISPDYEFGVTCDVSATFLGGGALYTLPLAGERLNLSFGGELDYYMVEYTEYLFDTYFIPGGAKRRAEGSGVGFHVGGGLEAFLEENTVAGLKVLYRIIEVAELETKEDPMGLSVEGDPLRVFADVDLSQTKRLKLDLGGLNAYLTICFYFG